MSEPDTWMPTETGRWPHNTALPGGSASQRNEIDDHSQKADRGGRIFNLINQPLPWIILAAAAAFLALGMAISNQGRIADNVAAQNVAIKAAYDKAYDAQTQSLLLRDYVDKLRIELASHGIKPPEYPAELKR